MVLGGGDEGLNKAQEVGGFSHSCEVEPAAWEMDVGESKRLLGGQGCSLECLVH